MDIHDIVRLVIALIVILLFWEVFRLRPRRRPPAPGPLEKTTPGKLYQQILKECPDCHKPPIWRAGPEGGMSQNIQCNHCEARFNVMPFGWAERLPKGNRRG